MKVSTFNTALGYLYTRVQKLLKVNPGTDKLDDIFNYYKVDDKISTSGQPTEQQFALIASKGFCNVINLLPDENKNAIEDEAGVVRQLGMRYFYIPVDFDEPKESDFQQFVTVMNEAGNEKTWIHCAANMRVSAFLYRYRVFVKEESEKAASMDLHNIWVPFGSWKKFIVNGC